MTIEIDPARLAKRATREWSHYAGEPVECEVVGGALYAFGSELACLRLAHKFRHGRAAYSENMKSWYYCKELHPTVLG